MDEATRNDIRDVALKLDEIYEVSPADYYYLKGFIHCLMKKAEEASHMDKRVMEDRRHVERRRQEG